MARTAQALITGDWQRLAGNVRRCAHPPPLSVYRSAAPLQVELVRRYRAGPPTSGCTDRNSYFINGIAAGREIQADKQYHRPTCLLTVVVDGIPVPRPSIEVMPNFAFSPRREL
jgi:hypothetical protein